MAFIIIITLNLHETADLLLTGCALILVSCTKSKTVKDTPIFGVYHGKTHMYGVGTPRPYDTVVNETFTITDMGDGRISIQSTGRLGMIYGIITVPDANHFYVDGCYGADQYHILPEQQQLIVKTEFTAGMGGMIHNEFLGLRNNQ